MAREDGIWQVSFRDRGRLDAAPFAKLDEDVQRGNGRETVKVLTRGLSVLKIAVHNYSNESSLSASNAEVIVSFGERRRTVFSAPADDYGRWWTVAEYDHATAQVRMVDALSETEPAGGPDMPHALTELDGMAQGSRVGPSTAAVTSRRNAQRQRALDDPSQGL